MYGAQFFVQFIDTFVDGFAGCHDVSPLFEKRKAAGETNGLCIKRAASGEVAYVSLTEIYQEVFRLIYQPYPNRANPNTIIKAVVI